MQPTVPRLCFGVDRSRPRYKTHARPSFRHPNLGVVMGRGSGQQFDLTARDDLTDGLIKKSGPDKSERR